MIITLDGQRVHAAPEPAATLQQLVNAIRAQAAGRLVVSVAVDGRELTDEQLSDALGQAVPPGAQVDFETADPRELSLEALRATRDELRRAAADAAAAAGRLNAGDVAGGMGAVGPLVQVWRAVYQAVVQCGEACRVDLTRIQFDAQSVADHLAALAERLRELRDALDARDFVRVADFLHYEFPPLCEFWQSACNALAEQLMAPAAE